MVSSEEAVGRGAIFSEPKWEVESGSVLGAWHAHAFSHSVVT